MVLLMRVPTPAAIMLVRFPFPFCDDNVGFMGICNPLHLGKIGIRILSSNEELPGGKGDRGGLDAGRAAISRSILAAQLAHPKCSNRYIF